MNLNRESRRLLSLKGQAINAQLPSEDLKGAEEAIGDPAANQSSYATSMSVLAHTWFTLDQTREAARLTYDRAISLRLQGRDMSTTQSVRTWRDADQEIKIVEQQLIGILDAIVADPDEGLDPAFGLLAAQHTSVQSGISVMLPRATQVRLALESGILAPEDSGAEKTQGDPPGE